MVELIESIELNQDMYGPLVNTPEQEMLYKRFDEKWVRYLDLGFEFFECQRDIAARLTE